MDRKEVEESKEESSEDKPKPKLDVLDLPALNLSESDSSDSEGENVNQATTIINEECDQRQERNVDDENSVTNNNVDVERYKYENAEVVQEKQKADKQGKFDVSVEASEDLDSSNSLIQNIWDNFKNYQASKEKLDSMFTESEKTEEQQSEGTNESEISPEISTIEVVLRDHDYCLAPAQKTDSSIIEVSLLIIQ